nr:Chain A, 7S-cis-cis-nepetalactol cyclase [Nepeta racemosa]6F9Q_B Chain B, 7S-cis-cis-nepetalactol cyclase [Nepeta racemosa]6F9Q_C Chain C, 7S-cis-cis-nepetalactol cyclase [Nepeta racemosa]6F9Q_D Chain D, 7S-cis-cis-nepetalactol cyclase [Nepeta racemosa]
GPMANNSVMMKKKLEGKVAIVTGGASGIGEATARLFVKYGARAVVIADIQSELGRSVAESIGKERCSFVQCDVADEEQVKSMIEWTATTYGGLDVMFSNAGVLNSAAQTVKDLDLPLFDKVMRVNTRGAAVCVKQAARKMVELGRGGSIICNAGSSAVRGAHGVTDYVMSKHAVIGLVRSASMQLGAHSIRVNSVSPMAVATPLTRNQGISTPDDVQKFLMPFISLKGVPPTAEQVAEAAAFLGSDEAAFVTGHDLPVDGGVLCMPFLLGSA